MEQEWNHFGTLKQHLKNATLMAQDGHKQCKLGHSFQMSVCLYECSGATLKAMNIKMQFFRVLRCPKAKIKTLPLTIQNIRIKCIFQFKTDLK